MKTPRGPIPGYALIALGVLAAAEVLLFLKAPLVRRYFYTLAWWPYIILADGLLYNRRGWSLLKSRPQALLTLLPWSVTIWLLFELFNLRLGNWHYVSLVADRPLRWLGYTLSFATVLPGLFVTALLVREFRSGRRIRTPSFDITPGLESSLMGTGLLFLLLPLFWPRYFFPLVWGGFVFLLDPVNRRMGRPSFLGDLSQGRPGRALELLTAGLVCGFLWEFWNYWAESKWIYTVPFVGDIKLFEMPVLGFLGFPPFALECDVLYNTLGGLGLAFAWDPQNVPGRLRSWAPILMVGQVFFWAWAYGLIDRVTVLSFH